VLKDRKVWINQELVPFEKATVPILSHSFSRGSAIFDVLSLHNTDLGPAVFRLDEHLKRLFRSAELLGYRMPLASPEVGQAVLDAVKANGLKEGAIKIVAYFGDIAFDAAPPDKPLDLAIFTFDPAEDLGFKGGLGVAVPKGVSACISKWRKLHPATVPVEAKAAANYLNGMLSRMEARSRGFDQAIMLDVDGYLAEGATESFFLVKNGVVKTPGLGTILSSISRKSVLEVARASGVEASEARLKPEDLLEADEAFTTATPFKILPLSRIEDKVFPEGLGPVSAKLGRVLEEACLGRKPEFKAWLFPVK